VQEKLAQLAFFREGINAHLTAAIAAAEPSPGGLLMPNQSLLYTGRVFASSQLPAMMHIARELVGGQICVTPDAATFRHPETAPWMEKFYTINEDWVAEDRRKLLAFARDLINSDYAGHRLTFQLFAQSPPFANLAAVYRSFDWSEPLAFVQKGRRVSRGSTVVTSGFASDKVRSIFPRGIPIGRVTRADLDEVELYQQVHVRPFADLRRIDYVQVLASGSGGERAEVPAP
jgi:4-hydroxyphenylacetate 3-monooxygenase